MLQERERQRERLQSNVVVHVEAPLLVVVHVHFYAREVVLGAARQEHGVRRADRVVLRVAVRGAPLRGPRLRRAGPAGDGATRANPLSCSQSQVLVELFDGRAAMCEMMRTRAAWAVPAELAKLALEERIALARGAQPTSSQASAKRRE